MCGCLHGLVARSCGCVCSLCGYMCGGCRVEAIIMSAGELESDRAGEPGRLIRDRYRRAAELSRVRGKLSCLMSELHMHSAPVALQ